VNSIASALDLPLWKKNSSDKTYGKPLNGFNWLEIGIWNRYPEDEDKEQNAQKIIRDEIEKFGFDAIKSKNHYVVFKPSQVKYGFKMKDIKEASWASEVGALRSELSEIQSIYTDFDSIASRIIKLPEFDVKAKKSLLMLLNKARGLVFAAEIQFREITKSPKAPARSPIEMSAPSKDMKKELQRISLDLSMLSVKIRNIGQATDEFENVKVSDVAETFEAASEIVRRAFVKFNKHVQY
jgi:hypothetical protein